jgi:nucleoside-diphosphate-sugar epimerase
MASLTTPPTLLPDIPVTPTELKALNNKVVAVTGAGGYVASHLVARLLAAGATVRACVRSASSAEHLRELEQRYAKNKNKLELHTGCDLLVPGSFDAAFSSNGGVDYVFHTASPFQMAGKGEDLLKTAVGGTREVLSACARVAGPSLKRVVLTSSVAALHAYIPSDRAGENKQPYTQRDWNAVASPSYFPYEHSKAQAERWAWRFVHEASGGKAQVPDGAIVEGGEGVDVDKTKEKIAWSLTAVNPGFVLGPPLASRTDGESVNIACKLLQDGMLGAWPDVHFGACDVRDVAAVHALAAISPEAGGKRLIVAPHRSSFGDLVGAVKNDAELLPRVRLPRRAAFYAVLLVLSPLLSFMGLPPYRVRLTYGVQAATYDCGEAEDVLRKNGVGGGGGGGEKGGNGSVWTPRDQTVTDMARVLLARGLVRDASATA